MLSGYFDQVPSHQNGVCEEKAAEEAEAQDQASAATVAEAAAAPAVVAESSEAEEQSPTADPGPDHSLKTCSVILLLSF